MATFSITNITSTTFDVTFTLGYPFDKRYYQEIGIAFGKASDSIVAPTGVICSVSPVVEESTSYTVSFTYTYSSDFVVGETYAIYGYAKDVSNDYYWNVGTGINVTIPEDISSYPDKPVSPFLVGRYSDGEYYSGLTLSCNVKGTIGTIEWRYRKSGDGDWMDNGYYTHPEQEISFGGLEVATVYEFQICVYYASDNDLFNPSEWSNTFYTITAPSIYTVAEDGYQCYFLTLNQLYIANDPGYLGDSFDYGIVTVKGPLGIISSDDGGSRFNQGTQKSFFYSKLTEGVYTVEIHTYLEYEGEDIEPVDELGNIVYFSKELTVKRPDKFYWTDAELEIFTNHGKVEDISYARINAFKDYVEEMLSYKGLLLEEPDNNYGTGKYTYKALLAAAKISSSDKTLYALKFNIINYCICKMLYTGITDKVKGDVVYGEYFTKHLLDTLNQV